MKDKDYTKEDIGKSLGNNKRIKLYNISKVLNMLSLIFLALDLLYICFKQREALDFIIKLIKEEADSFYFAESTFNIPIIIALTLLLIFVLTSAINIVLRKNFIVKYTIKE